ncbi:hypothetical protein CQA01_40350 [Cyclobacterium qasimii]|uniref:DUF4038 domain-containing protein n=3 Tax=Cyclobacterium qasimii TaxID=1350429 RepID=A0A512CH12_9BACT|nr:hypothetical protein CQA01_40350 [Cyclobacterium qasimii]
MCLNAVFAVHVYEVVEVSFSANNKYNNPYMDVNFDVTLNGPGGKTYTIPTFWDGENTWKARLVATEPGTWNWSTGTGQTKDNGLDGKNGSFTAEAWTEAEKEINPNRRGFIRTASNNRSLEYADGTPFFLIGDTWWSALTRTYRWSSSEGVSNISFQDAVGLRKKQGFNSINIISSFPTDNIKGIWHKNTQGEKVAEDGTTPFQINGDDCDHLRINPGYFQQADKKWQYFSDNGFVIFLESVRRSEAWPNESSIEKDAFMNYTRYIWARWGCYNMIYSWLHMDEDQNKNTWSSMLEKSISELGSMPYGQPRTAMTPHVGSHDYWNSNIQAGLDVHNISNNNARENDTAFPELREIFYQTNKPGFNIEGFYPDFWWANSPQGGMSQDEYALFIAYGCVLNGGFPGYVWGDAYWGGTHYKTGDPHINGFNRWSAAKMKHLASFILDEGYDYRTLKPASVTHLVDNYDEFVALAISEDHQTILGIVPVVTMDRDIIIKDLPIAQKYQLAWWDIDNGGWQGQAEVTSLGSGKITLPETPNKKQSWAFKLTVAE